MLKGDLAWKVPLICIVAAFCVWKLFFPSLKENIHLGLDLQGGVHLVLEVQTDEAVQKELNRNKDSLTQELKKEKLEYTALAVEPGILKITAAKVEDLTKIDDYLKNTYPQLEKKGVVTASTTDISYSLRDTVVKQLKDNSVKQSLMTINKRVNELGLTEPVIQQEGEKRIIVELPGEKDPQRAIDVIGKMADLRFQLVKESAATKEDLLERYHSKIPEGTEILYAAVGTTKSERPQVYLVEKEAQVTGADLKDARESRDEMGAPAVSFEFNRDGARRFGRLTEANINKQLAIVLDKQIQSAPSIRSKITDSGQITGSFSQAEANDLAIVLRAGALPAPAKILQNISIGPSLGEDSIRAGLRALVIGAIVVVLFMIAWYKLSGLIADIAVALNIFFILSTLAYFHATLTLPGLAGIALTVGMAVDSNILIYERIKEELRTGKTVRSAVENGFSRALITVVDANLTTLMAGIILFQFGTGTIKGFAITLSVGIIFTLFTAVTVTKVIFDLLLQSGKVKRLSI